MSGANGKYKSGITVYFVNDESGKTVSVLTQKDGWLLTGKLTAGRYTIPKLYIETENGNTIYHTTLEGPFHVAVEDGKVNNLGAIQINVGDGGYFYELVDYDSIRLGFQSDFPDSEWNGYEWVETAGFGRK